MKYFAEFYHIYRREDGSSFYHNPAGSFSIVQLDGRMNMFNMHTAAADECDRRKFDGYRIGRCNSLLDDMFYLTAAVQPVSDRAKEIQSADVVAEKPTIQFFDKQ